MNIIEFPEIKSCVSKKDIADKSPSNISSIIGILESGEMIWTDKRRMCIALIRNNTVAPGAYRILDNLGKGRWMVETCDTKLPDYKRICPTNAAKSPVIGHEWINSFVGYVSGGMNALNPEFLADIPDSKGKCEVEFRVNYPARIQFCNHSSFWLIMPMVENGIVMPVLPGKEEVKPC